MPRTTPALVGETLLLKRPAAARCSFRNMLSLLVPGRHLVVSSRGTGGFLHAKLTTLEVTSTLNDLFFLQPLS